MNIIKIHNPWLMWSVTISFVFFQFFLQLSAGVMLTPLMRTFHLNAVDAGILAASFYFIYMLLQTPAGMLVDRYGPRRLLALGGFVCALGCLLFANSHSFHEAISARLLMGAGASFAFVSSLYLVGQWFPETRFAMMAGLAETIGMCGTLIGNVYLAHIIATVPWRKTMLFSSCIAALLGLFCYLIVRDKKPEENELANITTPQTFKDFFKDVMKIIKQFSLWMNGLYAGLLFCTVTVFAALWAIPYLRLAQGLSLPTVTFECAMLFIGIAVGSPIMGYLYPRLQHKRRFLSMLAIIAAIQTLIIIFIPKVSAINLSTQFFLLGAVCSCYVFNYSIANHAVPKHTRSTAIGFTNAICVGVTPLLQPFLGYVLHIISTPIIKDHLHHYHIHEYQMALLVIPGALLIAAVVAWIIPKAPFINTR